MTQTVIITEENILDVYLEFGMPEEFYNLLTERATPEAKQIIHNLTVDGLEHLQGSGLSVENAFQVIFAAIFDLTTKP
jgi:hypothetical protein